MPLIHLLPLAFAAPQAVRLWRPLPPPRCPPRRARHLLLPRMSVEEPPDSSNDNDEDIHPPYRESPRRAPWDDVDIDKAFGEITEEEKEALRAKLPRRVADFLIRRADAAVAQRDAVGTDGSFLSKVLKDLPPDVPDWEAEENSEYKDYLYESVSGPPTFRRKGSSLFGGGDGLPKGGEGETGKRKMSLFVGNVGSVDERASQVGYSVLFLVGGVVVLKVLAAFVSFFVSFTFSFLAIFALSAGIFVVFFLLRF